MLGLVALLSALTVAVSGPAGSPEYLPIHVAAAEGYFTREGLEVTLLPSRTEIDAAQALALDRANLAATSLEAMLRWGPREEREQPRLVFGLTAAPPVALIVSRPAVPYVSDLRGLEGRRIGLSAPGVAETTWLLALLDRAHLRPNQVELVSLGDKRVAAAIGSGNVPAGLVAEPAASRLLADGGVRLLADLRTPEAARHTLGVPTVNAAVFFRDDTRPPDAALAAFARAVLDAEARIATAAVSDLITHLPSSVVGTPDEFATRLETTRRIYLSGGIVSPAEVRATVAMVRARLPLPPALKIPRPAELLHVGPLQPAGAAQPAR